ncbi:MAG TPA: beta-L-arabinofuranosidase domain-containing protein, partial [Candidatus Dormibacteraeota bacterium]|nr:beta-L-arabinofuranosidase domain-containing protein [Candidatus Dormibacteraeota bacterium]
LHGDSKYLDVLERVVYNGFLAGVGMTGDQFFYPNPLESDGKATFNMGSCQRAPWFGCSCCPVNDVRFIPEISSFIYATRGQDLFVNLFIGGSAKVDLNGMPVGLHVTTRYPRDGAVAIMVAVAGPTNFTLNVRVPGWARNQPFPSDLYRYDDGLSSEVKLAVNAQAEALNIEKGFARITRTWHAGDVVTLVLPMAPRRVVAHPAVAADRNRFAVERGPLVFCAEGADNGGKVLDKVLSGKLQFQTDWRPDLLGGVTVVRVLTPETKDPLTLIPYYAWCHRGPNEMRVWFPTADRAKQASLSGPATPVFAEAVGGAGHSSQ